MERFYWILKTAGLDLLILSIVSLWSWVFVYLLWFVQFAKPNHGLIDGSFVAAFWAGVIIYGGCTIVSGLLVFFGIKHLIVER